MLSKRPEMTNHDSLRSRNGLFQLRCPSVLAGVFPGMCKVLSYRIHDFFWYKMIKGIELRYTEFNSKFL